MQKSKRNEDFSQGEGIENFQLTDGSEIEVHSECVQNKFSKFVSLIQASYQLFLTYLNTVAKSGKLNICIVHMICTAYYAAYLNFVVYKLNYVFFHSTMYKHYKLLLALSSAR